MKKAFTLVELIVVITILALLGTIAFISLSNYAGNARDTKRLSNINNIYTKVSIELSKGKSLNNLISTINTGFVTINGNNQETRNQGIVNFNEIKENRDNFNDEGTDFPISYSKGGTGTGRFEFIQIATISETRNQAVLVGNYFKFQENDSESIILNQNGDFVYNNGDKLPYYKEGIGGRIDGVCGINNGISLPNIPSNNLCESGIASSVIGNGPYNWTCSGLNGGTNSQCSAKKSTVVGSLPGLLVAYGITKLNENYNGPAIKLRRGNDNVENDFYFDQNGNLDKNSINNWLNGSTGYVTTWYDQNTNGLNLIQPDINKQPILNSEFKIETFGGRRLYSLDNSNFNIGNGKAIYLKYKITNLNGDYQSLVSTRNGENGLIFYKTPSSGNQIQSWIRNPSGWNPMNIGTGNTNTSYFFINFSSSFPRKAIYNGTELSSFSPGTIYDNDDLFLSGINTGNGDWNSSAMYEYLVILDPSNTQNYTNFVTNVIPNL